MEEIKEGNGIMKPRNRSSRKIDGPEDDALRVSELESRKSRQEHRLALANLRTEEIVAKLDNKSRRADAVGAAKLDNLNREAKVFGTRARIAHGLHASGEIKALRLAKVRRASLFVLLPALTAFAAWSTVGVHKGVTKILQATPGDGTWNAAWGVEPALIAVVALVIIVNAILRSMGGHLGKRATAIELTALGSSIMLNLAGAWPEGGASPETLPAIIGHSVGPLGCAAVALLISIIDDGVAKTNPWKGSPSVDDVVPGTESVPVSLSPVTVSETAVPVPVSQPVPQLLSQPVPVSLSQNSVPVSQVVPETVSQSVPRPASRPVPRPASRPVPRPASRVRPATVSQVVVPDFVPEGLDVRQTVVDDHDRALAKGESVSVRAISERTGVSKSVVSRHLAATNRGSRKS